MGGTGERGKRLFQDAQEDQRNAFQRDRDRVLYSSAFRRLGGVTQVVSADQGPLFHNRLTHSIKVAQVARRLAERLADAARPAVVDVDVVECAALSHDLGHPPFGHIGEMELNTLVENAGDAEGYEGNAQSFRILTKLAVRFDDRDGLNLTRASLAATLKYPWTRDRKRADRSKKWGAYSIDSEAFAFAMDGLPEGTRGVEASIMDLADDLAYSVHDSEDFHRVGLIPWLQLTVDAETIDGQLPIEGEALSLVNDVVQGWWKPPESKFARAAQALGRLLGLLPMSMRTSYQGTRQQRQELRFWTSTLLGRYIPSARIIPNDAQGEAVLDADYDDEVRVLKAITRRYAIRNPALAAQQYGQRRILRELFDDLSCAVKEESLHDMIPVKFRHLVAEWQTATNGCRPSAPRVVADCISSMTEEEAILLHRRLRGSDVGSVLNPILR